MLQIALTVFVYSNYHSISISSIDLGLSWTMDVSISVRHALSQCLLDHLEHYLTLLNESNVEMKKSYLNAGVATAEGATNNAFLTGDDYDKLTLRSLSNILYGFGKLSTMMHVHEH